jgi:hypothetical protein
VHKHQEVAQAMLALAFILGFLFFPALWGGKTLLLSASDAASIMPSGAYYQDPPSSRIGHAYDRGSAWTSDPWLKVISKQILVEHNVPLWNPYAAYGTPLAAAMQPQPFFPLTALLSIYPGARTYNLFVLARLFVAGLLMFLFARMFVGHLPAILAAVSFMLTGRFIVVMDMPFLSVEILLPGLLAAFELLLRRPARPTVALVASGIALGITGGMPESLFMIVAFACLYFLFRLLTTFDFRQQIWSRVKMLTAAIMLGFALGAFLLLPFVEFMANSRDIHRVTNLGGGVAAGLWADANPRIAATYLIPLIFGPIWGHFGWSGVRGYWGVLPCLLATAAVLGASVRKRSGMSRTLTGLTVFFGASLVLMLLKQFGSPVINWIGRLPIANMVNFPSYQQPLMAVCIAMLAGIGLSLLVGAQTKRVLMGWGFVGLVVAELSFNFVVPSFYWFSSLPSVQSSPYAGAPYIEFLRARDQAYDRVFAREGFLHPDWAGAFDLADVRSLDAMYYWRYIDFIRNFLRQPDDNRMFDADLGDRFTGQDPRYPYAFATEREQRFLSLSSIRYLIGANPFGALFNEIYTGEPHIAEVPNALPRASLFQAAEVLSDDAVLARLKDPAFDPARTVVLSAESLDATDAAHVAILAQAPPAAATAARITTYESQRVVIKATTDRPALLMLNDANYPGWQVTVNGNPTRMLKADYLFRGVMLRAGQSVVEFRYAPTSFRAGALISAIALMVMVGLAFGPRFRLFWSNIGSRSSLSRRRGDSISAYRVRPRLSSPSAPAASCRSSPFRNS